MLKHLKYLIVLCLFTSSYHLACSQVINYNTKITIENNATKTTEKTILIQINNKDENWLSHIELSHNPNQEFSLNYAYLLDNKGNKIRKLKKKELITRNDLSYQSFYQDDMISEFDLYWNQYPYRIEYNYTIKEKEYLYVAWWSPFIISNTSTLHSSLEVHLPADFGIKIHNPANIDFKESEVDNLKILEWQSSIVSKVPTEIYSSPVETLIPIVKLVPTDFKYGLPGKTDSWSSFGHWFEALNNDIHNLTPKEKKIVEKLVDGLNERNDIIKTIYYYLQDKTKYVNVDIDLGGLKSYPASFVCEKKYGDCKALTTYMKAMLHSVGIKSNYTIVKAGENNRTIDKNLPSQQFNHVILMIPSEKDTIWLENTSSVLPFGYLGTFTQDRFALAIDGAKSQLVKTPTLSIDDVLVERIYNYNVADINKVQVDLELILRGKSFEKFRNIIAEKDEEKNAIEINMHHGIKNFTIDNWDFIESNRDSTFSQLNINGSASSILRELGSFKVINPLKIVLPDFEKPENRKLDVVINYPINRYDKSVYDLQDFLQGANKIPQGINIQSEYGTYFTDFKKNNKELIVVEKFTLLANKISIKNYDSLYDFMDSIKNYKSKSAILIK